MRGNADRQGCPHPPSRTPTDHVPLVAPVGIAGYQLVRVGLGQVEQQEALAPPLGGRQRE
ncbi:MAG: hypothetical protein OXN97_03010 [Bryobacterales bacterium]|nr:hypothetical protein [Bryobacterales bacterium]